MYNIAPTLRHHIQLITHEIKTTVLTAGKGHHYRAEAI